MNHFLTDFFIYHLIFEILLKASLWEKFISDSPVLEHQSASAHRCEILLCSKKGFAFISHGQLADHEIVTIAIGAKFNVYGLIMANLIILCIFKVYNNRQVQNQAKLGFRCFPYPNQKYCLLSCRLSTADY